MNIFQKLLLVSVAILWFASCSKDGDELSVYNPKLDESVPLIDIQDTDDGDTITIYVKIGIDYKGWCHLGTSQFRRSVCEQFERINARFNACGQVGEVKLNRYYRFIPDVSRIYVYHGCSYFGETVTKLREDMKDLPYKLCVFYDFYYEGSERGEYGGGILDWDGTGFVLVIDPGESAKNVFHDHFDDYGYRAITHEFGHSRGAVDLYAEVIESENNYVNQLPYHPDRCIMNDVCYAPDSYSCWSQYAIKKFNYTLNRRIPSIIGQSMYETMPEEIALNVTHRGMPVDAEIRFYCNANYKYYLPDKVIRKECVTEGRKVINTRSLFFPDNNLNNRSLILAVAHYNGETRSVWLPDYKVDEAGLDGETTYEVNFDF